MHTPVNPMASRGRPGTHPSHRAGRERRLETQVSVGSSIGSSGGRAGRAAGTSVGSPRWPSGTTLRAIHAPGHTQGATIWTTTVDDGGRKYNVAFLTTTTPNPGVALLNNPRHKNVVEDTRRTFRKLKAEREPDIVLVGHPQAMFAGTMERLRRGDRPHPLLNGAEAWTRQLAVAEADFERRVAQEQPRR